MTNDTVGVRQYLFTLLFFLFGISSAYAADQPNIVLIMADDMGYGDVQAYNDQAGVPTPNLNRLAKQGMRFTDAHSPAAVCTPSRYGLLTGRYSWRTRRTSGVIGGGYQGKPLISSYRATIGSLLQKRGYHTGIVGKWHLGVGWQPKENTDPDELTTETVDFSKPLAAGPHTTGFDYSYTIPVGLDMPPYVFVKNGMATQRPTVKQEHKDFAPWIREGPRSPSFHMSHVRDHLTLKSTSFIERQARRRGPFLLYFPLTAPHKPTLAAPRFRGSTGLGPYGDLIHQVDWTVGQILDALQRTGQKKDTLVLFTSDNGSYMNRLEGSEKDHTQDHDIPGYLPENHTPNGPLRGIKEDVWEGGHRVPFIVRWPGEVDPNSTNDTPVCLTDVLATLVDITRGYGAERRPDDVGPDSFSILPLLRGESMLDRPPIIHSAVHGMRAIRDGKWKLVLGNGSGGRTSPHGSAFKRPYQLYNMKKDPYESNNVIDQHPEVAEDLEKTFKQVRETPLRIYQEKKP